MNKEGDSAKPRYAVTGAEAGTSCFRLLIARGKYYDFCISLNRESGQ